MGRQIQDVGIDDVLDNALHHDRGARKVQFDPDLAIVSLTSQGGIPLDIHVDGTAVLTGHSDKPEQSFTITYSPTTPFTALIAAFRL